MASILKVDTIQDQDGNNIISESANVITIGASGDTITIPSGASMSGFNSTGIDDNATSTAVTIDSSGDVGIGTSTIQNQASGRTVLQLENTSTAMLNLGINGTRRGYLFSSSSDLSLVATTSTPLFFG